MRTLALIWFLAGFFLASVLAVGGVLNAGWPTATRQWSTRTNARTATVLALLGVALLAPGVAFWNANYAQ